MIEQQQKLSATAYQQLVKTFYTNFSRSKFCLEQLIRQRGAEGDASESMEEVRPVTEERVKNMARRLLYTALMEDKLSSADQLKAAALKMQINARLETKF